MIGVVKGVLYTVFGGAAMVVVIKITLFAAFLVSLYYLIRNSLRNYRSENEYGDTNVLFWVFVLFLITYIVLYLYSLLVFAEDLISLLVVTAVFVAPAQLLWTWYLHRCFPVIRPVHIGVVTFNEERLSEITREGETAELRHRFVKKLMPRVILEGRRAVFYPFGFIDIDTSLVQHEFVLEVMTPDNVHSKITIQFFFRVSADYADAYIEIAGGLDGIMSLFDQLTESIMVPYIRNKDVGPQEFTDLMAMLPEVRNAFVEGFVNEVEPEYTKRQKNALVKNIKRQKSVDLPALGIKLVKVVIGKTEEDPKVREAARRQAIENLEREGELVEAKTDVMRAEVGVKALLDGGHITEDEWRQVFLERLERVEVNRLISGGNGSAIVLDSGAGKNESGVSSAIMAGAELIARGSKKKGEKSSKIDKSEK